MFIINALALSLFAVVYVAAPIIRRYKDDVFAAAHRTGSGSFAIRKNWLWPPSGTLTLTCRRANFAESDHAELVAAQQRLTPKTEQQLARTSTPRKGQSSGLCPACGQSLAPAARFCSRVRSRHNRVQIIDR